MQNDAGEDDAGTAGVPEMSATRAFASDVRAELPRGFRIGEFTIERRIGGGAMGDVYEARQENPGRAVAVKVIRSGQPVGALAGRFAREAAALGRLRHSGIAAIYAAGAAETPRGRLPYFAMELVEGAHITRYCDDHQLNLDARLGLLVQVCRAVRHAHGKGVLHRDLKPSNILVSEQDGRPVAKVIDFGIAKVLDDAGLGERHRTLDGQPVGTPQYMSPEQAGGDADVDTRSDIFSLGLVAYEVLCGVSAWGRGPRAAGARVARPSERVRELAPGSREHVAALRGTVAKRLVKQLRGELGRIILKALEAERDGRYATADALAADLENYRAVLPLAGVREGAGYWLRSRMRRHPGVTALVGLLLVLAPAVILLAYHRQRAARADAQAAQSRAEAAWVRADSAAAGERAQRFESRLHALKAVRLNMPVGWSERAAALAREAAGLGEGERWMADVSGCLYGLDARMLLTVPHGGESVAFSPDGSQLVVAGEAGSPEQWTLPPAGPTSRPSAAGGAGPVGFDTDGAAIQVMVKSTGLELVRLNVPRPTVALEGSQELALARDDNEKLLVALSASATAPPWLARKVSKAGAFVAAATRSATGASVVVWDGNSGKITDRIKAKASALAVAPANAGLIAIGDEKGSIAIRSIAGGEMLARLEAGPNRVNALAFAPDLHFAEGMNAAYERASPQEGWLLAASYGGGRIIVWDLATRMPRSSCYGSHYDVYALGFSPDGATLASAGRNIGKVWDVATGRNLLDLPTMDFASAVSFAPDGRRLAVASNTGRTGQVEVWELEDGRGVQTLRGLDAQIARVRLSPDGRLVAAISDSWQVGVWEVGTGQRRCVIQLSPGVTADNSALAFDPDTRRGQRLAVACGRRAAIWDVGEGREVTSWDLPPGLADAMGFHPSGRLLLLRLETEGGKDYPHHVGFKGTICRLRNLLGAEPLRPIYENRELRGISRAVASLDGEVFMFQGAPREGPARPLMLKAIAGLTGEPIDAALPVRTGQWATGLLVDPAGTVLGISGADDASMALVPVGKSQSEMPAQLARSTMGFVSTARGVATSAMVELDREGTTGVRIEQPWEDPPRLDIRLSATLFSAENEFDKSGQCMAWGCGDGTVAVADIGRCRAQLKALGWRR